MHRAIVSTSEPHGLLCQLTRRRTSDLLLLAVLRSDSCLDSQSPTLWPSCRQMQSRLITAVSSYLQARTPKRDTQIGQGSTQYDTGKRCIALVPCVSTGRKRYRRRRCVDETHLPSTKSAGHAARGHLHRELLHVCVSERIESLKCKQSKSNYGDQTISMIDGFEDDASTCLHCTV